MKLSAHNGIMRFLPVIRCDSVNNIMANIMEKRKIMCRKGREQGKIKQYRLNCSICVRSPQHGLLYSVRYKIKFPRLTHSTFYEISCRLYTKIVMHKNSFSVCTRTESRKKWIYEQINVLQLNSIAFIHNVISIVIANVLKLIAYCDPCKSVKFDWIQFN